MASGTDNANFATPPDGQNPRMQMYLWTPPGGQQEVVVGGTSYDAVSMGFGPGLSTTGLTGPLASYNDGVAPTGDACQAMARGSLAGTIAIVDRGACNFDLKVKNAQTAGAIGVIIANNVAGTPFAGARRERWHQGSVRHGQPGRRRRHPRSCPVDAARCEPRRSCRRCSTRPSTATSSTTSTATA